MTATFALDFLWPVFALAGVERFSIVPGYTAVNPLRFDHYPWSHSLLMVIGWAFVAGMLHWISRRRLTDSVVVTGLILSHWILDWVTHLPDLPLWPGALPGRDWDSGLLLAPRSWLNWPSSHWEWVGTSGPRGRVTGSDDGGFSASACSC